MTEPKPMKISVLIMVVLSLSILFTILAYGYGSVNQLKLDIAWCNDNIESIANEHGYTLLKSPELVVYNPLDNILNLSNIKIRNTTCINLSQDSSVFCEAP